MRSVALYGFAPNTREGVWQSKADEIWSLVWAYKYDLPRLDRLLEIHPIWLQAASQKDEYIKPREHWEWLKQNTTVPVYMTEPRREVPMCVPYPINAAMRLVPPARSRSVFSSSFDFLMAMAILEGCERIECYGIEMGSDTEFRYQREGAAYWIGYCDAHGIDLVLPENTALLSKRLYGYEGGSMIYRQDLERIKNIRVEQKRDAFARLAFLEGQRSTAASQDEIDAYNEKIEKQLRMCLVIDGALQEVEYQLKEVDLEEPDPELHDPITIISTEA